MDEKRETSQQAADTPSVAADGGALERMRRQVAEAPSAASAEQNPLGQLEGTLGHIGRQVGQLIAAVQQDAARMRAHAEEDARAIRTAAAAEAARQRAELDRRLRDVEAEIAQQRAEVDRYRCEAEAEITRERAEIDRLLQEAQAERARIERLLTSTVRALAAIQSALVLNGGAGTADDTTAAVIALLDAIRPPAESVAGAEGSSTGEWPRPMGEPAIVGLDSSPSGAAAAEPRPPLARAAPGRMPPGPGASARGGRPRAGPVKRPRTAEDERDSSDLVVQVEEQLHEGDVVAALETFRVLGRDPERSESAITRLSVLVDDPAYAAYRDEMLEVLAEAYLARTEREVHSPTSAVSEESSPL